MNTTPLVSVVIPVYNSAAHIAETLASVFCQEYGNFEVIVVDDGSSDGSGEIIRASFPGARYFRQPPSGRGATPRNAGVRHARGHYLAFLDSDDLMMPGALSQHMAALQSGQGAGVSLVNYQNFDSDSGADTGPCHYETCSELLRQTGIGPTKRLVRLDGRTARRILPLENFSITSTMMLERLLFEQLGGFDEALRASEDFDLLFRAARHSDLWLGWNVAVRRRFHNSNLSHQTARILGGYIQSRTKLIERENDRIAQDHLRQELGEVYLLSANAQHSVRRSARFRSLVKSISLLKKFELRHLKATVKLVLPWR